MKTGIVVGKFYPFHSGHAHLISQAKNQVDSLTVLVCDRSDQVFTGEERASWIREMFPDITVRVMRDILHDDDSELWAKYTIAFLGYLPDVVFTSEAYGEAYAKYMGVKHVSMDRERKTVPISGTRVRENPYANWKFISPPVRARLARRVALVGAESTGTTTLTRALAEKFKTVWVPEFGRFYTEGKIASQSEWKTEEFSFIAREQNRAEDFYARSANKILFCDTNAWATRLWHERYMGGPHLDVDAFSQGRVYDLVIVTNDDIPFVQDGLRDGENIRHAMQDRFKKLLIEEKIPYVVVSGSREDRLRETMKECEKLLISGEDIFQRFPTSFSAV